MTSHYGFRLGVGPWQFEDLIELLYMRTIACLLEPASDDIRSTEGVIIFYHTG